MTEIHDLHGMSGRLIRYNSEQDKSELHSAKTAIKLHLYVYLYLPLMVWCAATICPMHIYHTKLKHATLYYFYNLIVITL